MAKKYNLLNKDNLLNFPNFSSLNNINNDNHLIVLLFMKEI